MERIYTYYIYKTTCTITGKYYIGMRKTYKEEDFYKGSGKLLKASIAEHGDESHIKEILEYCENESELRKRESEIINKELLKDELCLNMAVGGNGGATMTGRKQSEETIEKRRKSNTGKKRSDKYKK